MIIPIHNVLNPQQLADIQASLRKAEWQNGLVTAGQQATSVKRNHQLPERDTLTRKLGDTILSALAVHPVFISAALPLKIYPPMFNRYEPGETYGLHVDNTLRVVPGTTVRVRTDLSATVFLSEPDDYRGGELTIEDQLGSREIKLAAGDMILYQATQLHRVTPIMAGCRYASFFWLQSMVRSHEQREVLFNLDQSVQSLIQQHGHEHEDVLRLSAVYQNLMRQFAET